MLYLKNRVVAIFQKAFFKTTLSQTVDKHHSLMFWGSLRSLMLYVLAPNALVPIVPTQIRQPEFLAARYSLARPKRHHHAETERSQVCCGSEVIAAAEAQLALQPLVSSQDKRNRDQNKLVDVPLVVEQQCLRPLVPPPPKHFAG